MVSTFHIPRFVLRGPQYVAFTRPEASARGDRCTPSRTAADGAAVPLSIWEDTEHVYIEADLPGMQPQAVDVRIEDDMLKISGERSAPQRAQQCRHDERSFGRFERAIGLGKDLDRTRVDAQLRDGVLSITLHKRPEARTQKVSVQYSSGTTAAPEHGAPAVTDAPA